MPAFVAPFGIKEYKVIVEMAFGFSPATDPLTWVWTDVSKYVRGQVFIQKGRTGLSGIADPTQITFRLVNNDGRFTADNPMLTNGQPNPYFPNVVLNVPVRVSITWAGAAGTYERATAFVNGWPIVPNSGVTDVEVPIMATGRLRRLRRSAKQVISAPARYLSKLTGTVPVAAWTLEEGRLVSGGTPLYGPGILRPFVGTHPSGAVVSYPQWGEGNLAPWLPPVVSPKGTGGLTIMWSPVVMTASPTTWSVDIAYSSSSSADGNIDINPAYLGGDLGWPQFSFFPSDSQISVSFNGAPEVTSTVSGLFDGLAHHIRWTASQSGANVIWSVFVDSALVNAGTATTYTLPSISRFALVTAAGSSSIAVGYVCVWTSAQPVGDMTDAILGHAGELATARAGRIAAENSIALTTVTGVVASQPMGPQSMATPAALLDEAAQIDNALLYDGGVSGNLVFSSGTARYNAPVALTLDYTKGHIGSKYAGTKDDQNYANDTAATRNSGATATSVDSTRIAIDDDYDQQFNVNAYTDGQMSGIASWQTHLSSFPGYRFPSSGPVDLRSHPELAQAVTALTLPARISPISVPAPPYPFGSIDQFAEGYVEVIDVVTWQIAFVCTPQPPWRVAAVQDPTNPWVTDCDGHSLNAGVTATATSWAVKNSTGHLMSTSGADYPRDMYVDGEVVTFTAVSGGSSPQTATVVRGVNEVIKSHLANAVVSLYRPATIAL